MKKHFRSLLCLMLALMLAASVSSMALATEVVIGQVTKDGYTITSVQYAYNDAGAVHLYDQSGETIVATIGNGAKLAVTNGQQGERTYVQFGATAGWINNSDLHEQLPQTITGEESGSSTPSQQLTPIQTTPPQQGSDLSDTETDAEDWLIEEEESAEAVEEAMDEEPAEPVGDPEKDHEPIAAMYEDGESDGNPVAVDVVQLGVVSSIILLDEERLEVDTALLTFGEEVPDEQKLGYVHAPRTGQAGLRETPAKDGKVITQLKAGQLVAVLAFEENYAHVNVQGQEGWLRLDCLKYLQTTDNGIVSSADLAPLGIKAEEDKAAVKEQAAEASGSEAASQTNDSRDSASNDDDVSAEVVITDNNGSVISTQPTFPSEGLLSCKGETDGATSVNLRNLPTKDSAKTAVLRTGVEVSVLSELEGWYLVEVDGVCGYVMEAFLELGV